MCIRDRVYTADKARRDIGGALWDSETDDGVVCSSAGRKELKLTCERRAAWAGMSGLRQDLFRASCDDPDTSWTLISYYKACLECLWGYLVRWGSLAVAARCFLEGLADKVRIEGWSADMAKGILFSSRNRLSRQDIWWQIKLSQDILAGASYGVGQDSLISRTRLFSEILDSFQKN